MHRPTLQQAALRNGALLALPPLACSLALWSLLPASYGPDVFWRDVPAWLGFGENALRILAFAVPFALYFGASTKAHRVGFCIYLVGLVIYAGSYLSLAFWPASSWAMSAVGFTAPAWTTSIWFLGIAMVCRDSWVTVRWRWWFYLGVVAGFLAFHVGHATLIWSRLSIPVGSAG